MATVADKTQDSKTSFAFEQVAVTLEPFDLMNIGETDRGLVQDRLQRAKSSTSSSLAERAFEERDLTNSLRRRSSQHALFPILMTGGLVFPYNPIISEGVSVNYDAVELTHANESFHVYRNTDNVRISIQNAVWTCDTFDNAVYALSVLHFFRTYSQMDFGKNQTGRPPSPMWFSAYGNYAFHRVPVLLEKADWSFPNDVDYVGIPEFDTDEYISRRLSFAKHGTGLNHAYTWLPMKFEVSSISLVVQHSPRFWSNWSLADYRSGDMLRSRKSFHKLPANFVNKRNPIVRGGD